MIRWFCRWFGHWDRRGPVLQGFEDHVADYRLCRVCGRYKETLRPGWRRLTDEELLRDHTLH